MTTHLGKGAIYFEFDPGVAAEIVIMKKTIHLLCAGLMLLFLAAGMTNADIVYSD